MRFDEIAWDEIDGPAHYRPDEVVPALRAMASARSRDEGRAARDRVLSTIGNNHAGTVYPAAVVALPFILEMAQRGEGWSRWCAGEVIDDWFQTFEAEPGHETMVDRSGETTDVLTTIRQMVRSAGLPRPLP